MHNIFPDETKYVKKTKTNVNTKTCFTFYVFFGLQKNEEVERRHVPSYYDKNQHYFLASTQLVFFDQIHIQQISGPPTTSQINEYNV